MIYTDGKSKIISDEDTSDLRRFLMLAGLNPANYISGKYPICEVSKDVAWKAAIYGALLVSTDEIDNILHRLQNAGLDENGVRVYTGKQNRY